MLNAQFDIKRINMLKNILLRLQRSELQETIQADIDQFFEDISVDEILLIEQELLNGDYGITIEDVKKLSSIHPHLYGDSKGEGNLTETYHPGHPVQIFKKENTIFQSTLKQINRDIEMLEKDPQCLQEKDRIEDLKHQIIRLGEFHKHYHRKEKLFFPIMERYGHYTAIRTMWRWDDRIRALYQGAKRLIHQIPEVNLSHVRTTYDAFKKEFNKMIFQEEAIILPILLSTFHEDDWLAIAKESEAFGYAVAEPEKQWVPASEGESSVIKEDKPNVINGVASKENIRFGGGYLTTEEANLILNSLPLEITFVDKNSVFKYFNQITKASEMMFVRTPTSIGRNAANCHPPKSLKKVMTLMRDLKQKKRTSESMWFKKRGQYVHLTYKAIFNEDDEFLGVLEYVQDIQPFFDLPSEVKRGLSELDE